MSILLRHGLRLQCTTLFTLLHDWESSTSLLDFYSYHHRAYLLLLEIENKIRTHNARFGSLFPSPLLIRVFMFLKRSAVFSCRSVCHYWKNELSSFTAEKILISIGVLHPHVVLGHAYRTGTNGLTQSYREGRRHYKHAADEGDAEGEAWLAYSYHNSPDAGAENYRESFRLSQLGVKKDQPLAYSNLGECYQWGEGVAKNLPEAVRLYTIGSKLHNSMAQYNLAFCYWCGLGIPSPKIPEAMQLLRLSVAQDNPRAQNLMGYFYESGIGVDRKDVKEAAKYYEMAVAQGDSGAQVNLGMCYSYGEGVERDLYQAYQLFQNAAGQGNERAKEKLRTRSQDFGIGARWKVVNASTAMHSSVPPNGIRKKGQRVMIDLRGRTVESS